MPGSNWAGEPESPSSNSSHEYHAYDESVHDDPANSSTDHSTTEREKTTMYATHPARFLILFTFSLLSFNQSLFWLTFSPITSQTMAYYSIEQSTVNTLLSWGPLLYIPLQFFSSWLSSQPSGLKKTVMLSSSLCLLATVLRLLPNWIWPQRYGPNDQTITHDREMFENYAVYFLHVAQALNGVAGPLVSSTVSQVSALWFAPNERARATSVALFSNSLGGGFCFIQVSQQISINSAGLTPDQAINESAFEIPRVLYTHMGMAIAAWILTMAYFPAHPKHSPSHAAKLIIDQDQAIYQSNL